MLFSWLWVNISASMPLLQWSGKASSRMHLLVRQTIERQTKAEAMCLKGMILERMPYITELQGTNVPSEGLDNECSTPEVHAYDRHIQCQLCLDFLLTPDVKTRGEACSKPCA